MRDTVIGRPFCDKLEKCFGLPLGELLDWQNRCGDVRLFGSSVYRCRTRALVKLGVSGGHLVILSLHRLSASNQAVESTCEFGS